MVTKEEDTKKSTINQGQSSMSIAQGKLEELKELKSSVTTLKNQNESLEQDLFKNLEAIEISEALELEEKLKDIEKKKELYYESGKILMDIMSMQIEVNRAKKHLAELNNEKYPPYRDDSNLMRYNQYLFLQRALRHDGGMSFNLLYRMSRDGATPEDFHRKCDGVEHTVIAVSCGAQVFGGYTSKTWDGDGFKADPKAFLINFQTHYVYGMKDYNEGITVHPKKFPHFGKEDLYFENNAFYSRFPVSFKSDGKERGLTQGLSEGFFDEMEVVSIFLSG